MIKKTCHNCTNESSAAEAIKLEIKRGANSKDPNEGDVGAVGSVEI